MVKNGENGFPTILIHVVEDLVQFGPKVHFRVYLDFFLITPVHFGQVWEV